MDNFIEIKTIKSNNEEKTTKTLKNSNIKIGINEKLKPQLKEEDFKKHFEDINIFYFNQELTEEQQSELLVVIDDKYHAKKVNFFCSDSKGKTSNNDNFFIVEGGAANLVAVVSVWAKDIYNNSDFSRSPELAEIDYKENITTQKTSKEKNTIFINKDYKITNKKNLNNNLLPHELVYAIVENNLKRVLSSYKGESKDDTTIHSIYENLDCFCKQLKKKKAIKAFTIEQIISNKNGFETDIKLKFYDYLDKIIINIKPANSNH